MSYQKYSLISAWRLVYSIRVCPPEELLMKTEKCPNTRSHLKTCPFCQETLNCSWYNINTMTEAGKELERMLASQDNSQIIPGQVWSLKKYLGGWGPENRYYNPPFVLILETFNEPAPGVRVAQICPVTDLIGPNDVMLGSKLGFAEAWNTFALAKEDLDLLLYKLSSDVVAQVKQEAKAKVEEISDDSILYQFRILELDVANFFTWQAISKMLDQAEYKKMLLPFKYTEKEAVKKSLKISNPELQFPEAVDDPLLMAGMSRLPLEDQAWAAESASASFQFNANLLLVDKSSLELESLNLEFAAPETSEKGIIFRGKFLENSVYPEIIQAWWIDDQDRIIQADETSLAKDKPVFRLLFYELNPGQLNSGRLILLGLKYNK